MAAGESTSGKAGAPASEGRLRWLTRSRETAAQYERWAAPFRQNPEALCSLERAGRLLKGLCYALYPVLLALAFLEGQDGQGLGWPPAGATFWRILIATAGGFALETVLRAWLDAPRPYESLGIDPLIPKATRGRSFPSRHLFSIFAIATCWLSQSVALGCALMLAGVVMGWIRVLGGAHHPRDVVAGALLGVACGALGLLLP